MEVRGLACAFKLATTLRANLGDGLVKLPSFLAESGAEPDGRNCEREAEEEQSGGDADGPLLWKDLCLFLVLDVLHDALARSARSSEHDSSLLEWTSLLVLALRRVLSAEADELRRHTDIFLRLRGSTHPLPRMPSWRWLCTRTSHDAKQTLIAGSEKLRALVEQAVVATTTAWLERFSIAVAEGNREMIGAAIFPSVLRNAGG